MSSIGNKAELVDAPELKSIVNIYTLANMTFQRLLKKRIAHFICNVSIFLDLSKINPESSLVLEKCKYSNFNGLIRYF